MAAYTSAGRKRGRIQTDENMSSATGEPAAPVNEFELERLRRIQHNKQVLADLGLENAAGALLAGNRKQAKQRSAKRQPCQRSAGEQVQQEQQPARRSRRLASQPAEAGSEQAQLEFE
jgi:signal transduction histidine kinase